MACEFSNSKKKKKEEILLLVQWFHFREEKHLMHKWLEANGINQLGQSEALGY